MQEIPTGAGEVVFMFESVVFSLTDFNFTYIVITDQHWKQKILLVFSYILLLPGY